MLFFSTANHVSAHWEMQKLYENKEKTQALIAYTVVPRVKNIRHVKLFVQIQANKHRPVKIKAATAKKTKPKTNARFEQLGKKHRRMHIMHV